MLSDSNATLKQSPVRFPTDRRIQVRAIENQADESSMLSFFNQRR